MFIDLRKYVNVAGREGGDHLFLATQKETRYMNCADASLPYYPSLVRDVRERTEAAMAQSHCFKVMELALTAQAHATLLN